MRAKLGVALPSMILELHMNSVHYGIYLSAQFRITLYFFPHVSANATMAEGGRESELVVADVPEDQKHLICVEYPGIHAHTSLTRNFSLCSRP